MNDNLDLAERLEKSFGDGPAPLPVDVHLRSGRRALLRRRLAAGASALAVVAVIGTGFAVIAGGPDDAAPVIDPAGPGASFDGVEEVTAGTKPAVVINGDTLEVAADVELTEVVKDPVDPQVADNSYGVAWERGGEPRWELYFNGDATGTSSLGGRVLETTLAKFPTFDAWLADAVERLESGDVPIGPDEFLTQSDVEGVDIVRFGQGEKLVAQPGFTIAEQTGDVDLPENFAGPGDRTAAALVMTADGQLVFVLARQVSGSSPEYIPTPAGEKTGLSIESFLEFAVTRYDSNEGLR